MRMARLHNYCVVCPLFEQNSFLGISEDKENDSVIITLGRNIISKYRLTDLKQIAGWTSKDHISAKVVYNHTTQQYCGVFNNNVVKLWEKDGEILDKLKKHKFPVHVLKIETSKTIPPVLIFANGKCASINYALNDKNIFKSGAIIQSNEIITDSVISIIDNVNYMVYIVDKNGEKRLLKCQLSEELFTVVKNGTETINIARAENVRLIGKLLHPNAPFAYFIWSDGKVFSLDLKTLKWKHIGVVQWLSCEGEISMQWICDNHLALFGSDQSKDGALVVIYNVSIGVATCRYPLKIYCNGAKLYCIGDSLILEAGNHLALVRFTLDISKSLSSLINSHEISEGDAMEVASWDEVEPAVNKQLVALPEQLKKGVTDRIVCLQYVVSELENKKFLDYINLLKPFVDVPESVVAFLLQKIVSDCQVEVQLLTDLEKVSIFFKSKKKLKESLCYIFSLSVSDNLLMPHLKNRLKFNDGIFLMDFICTVLTEKENLEYYNERKLINWFIRLLDCFYKHTIIIKDVYISEALNNYANVVKGLIENLNDVNNLLPKLFALGNKSIKPPEEDQTYSIELVKLF